MRTLHAFLAASLLVALPAPAGVTLKNIVGVALVIHADPDDEKTDPTGNSGGRVACGVIAK